MSISRTFTGRVCVGRFLCVSAVLNRREAAFLFLTAVFLYGSSFTETQIFPEGTVDVFPTP